MEGEVAAIEYLKGIIMGSIVDKLRSKNLIHPPPFLKNNIHYEVIMGSFAYGVSGDASDVDIYGFCIPPKNVVFPHLAGEIHGFGRQKKRFEQYQQHHILDPDDKKEYDITIYNIVKFFSLCMENNPNILDALFVPQRCIIHSTQLAERVRSSRKIFLHKGSWYKFKGYAYSQLHKLKNKKFKEGKRKEGVKKHGYDLKFAYHIVRLLNEIEQILIEHDLDLEKNREQLRSIRRGEWPVDQIQDYFNSKEKMLEDVYSKSTLQHSPDEKGIKKLLLECLEMNYGSLDGAIRRADIDVNRTLDEIESCVNKLRKLST